MISAKTKLLGVANLLLGGGVHVESGPASHLR